jgi:ectoine hydroxylase-related dioxygenase (phytanoyl-CoA dioxygenase family)
MLRRAARALGRPGARYGDRVRQCHDAPALSQPTSAVISDADKYFFDTNGVLILRQVLSKQMIAAMNAAIDTRMVDDTIERRGKLRLTAKGGPLSGDGTTGRKDIAGFLGWPRGEREAFRDVLTHPAIVPYLHELLGPGYRLDHNPLCIAQDPGAEGFEFHGGSTLDNGRWNWPLQYEYSHGQMRCSLLAVGVPLTKVNEGEGGFCIIRGSHKSNFAAPAAVKKYEIGTEHGYAPALDVGDVVLFSEATTHGTLAWKGDKQRRTLIYRFSPATNAYGRGYSPEWPENYIEDMTPAQRSTMAPPYHPRLDRDSVAENGVDVIKPAPREDFKVQFDEKIFKSKYF